MILVAGLALMGLAGIAAAFYFSMRPGSPRDGAVPGRSGAGRGPGGSGAPRGPRPGRAAGSRPPASQSRTSPPSSGEARPCSDGTGPSTVIDFTDPRMALEDSGPLVTGHRARHGGRQDDAPDVAATQRMAARGSHQADPDNADMTARSRRRVAWRKGTGVDEELWPAEEFGGVSDEQFWDDLAADRPLATTARTAQPDTAARRLPPGASPRPAPAARCRPGCRTCSPVTRAARPPAEWQATARERIRNPVSARMTGRRYSRPWRPCRRRPARPVRSEPLTRPPPCRRPPLPARRRIR